MATTVASGASFVEVTTLTPSWTSRKLGNLIYLTVGGTGTNSTPAATSVTSSHGTWTRAVTKGDNTAASDIWVCTVTGTVGAATITITMAAGQTIHDGGLLEFDSGLGTSTTWTNTATGTGGSASSAQQVRVNTGISPAVGDLVLAWAMVGGAAGTTITPAGFVQIQTASHSNGYAYQLTAAGGAITPTWTGDTSDLYNSVAASFTPSAGTVAARPSLALRARRFPWVARRRPYATGLVPLVAAAVTQPVPPQPARPRFPFRPRRVPEYTIPVPPAATIVVVQPAARRPRFLPHRRQFQAEPVQTPVAGPAPLPPQPQTRRIPFLPRRRAESTLVVTVAPAAPQQQPRRHPTTPPRRRTEVAGVPPTVQVTIQQPARPRRPSPLRARPSSSTPVPTTVTVTTQALPPQQPRPVQRGWLPHAKPRQAQPVQPGAIIITTQALPPQPARRVLRPWLPRQRSEVAVFVPAGTVVTTTGPLAPQPARRRSPLLPARRAKVSVAPTQVTVTVPTLRQRRPMLPSRRRGFVAQPPRVQVSVVQPSSRRRLIPPLGRRRPATIVPPTTITVTTTPPPTAASARRPVRWPLRRAHVATPVPTAVVVTIHNIPPQPHRNRFWPFPHHRAGVTILIGGSAPPPVVPYPVTPGQSTDPAPIVTPGTVGAYPVDGGTSASTVTVAGSTGPGRPSTSATTTISYPVTPE